MEFLEIDNSDILVMRGAAVGMAVDHNEEIYYVLCIVGGDENGEDKTVTFAIPPMVTDKFLRVANGMDPKREQSL